MAANKFVLKGSGVEVDYTIGANPSFPALIYTAGAFQKKFNPNQILSEDTGLGEMVSVASDPQHRHRRRALWLLSAVNQRGTWPDGAFLHGRCL